MLGTTNSSAAQAAMAGFSLTLNGANKVTYNGKTAVSLDITAAKIGAAAASHTHNYLPLSGGTLTGNISYNMYGASYIPLQVYGGDVNGLGIIVGGCASTIVASGEAGKELSKIISATTEALHLGSDGDINLYTKCDTFANKLTVTLDTARNFFPADNNAGSIGKQNNRWGNGYFNKLNTKASLTIIQATEAAIANNTPSIIFTNSGEGTGTQQVWIKYNDFDSYKVPAGLTICGNQGKEYLIVDGDIKSNKGILYTTSQIIFENGTSTSGNLRINATVPSAEVAGTNVNVSRYPLRWWGHEHYGIGVMVGDGGATIIGGGEAGDALKTALNITGGTEAVYIASDGPIKFFTNCQTIANRIESTLDAAAKFTTRYLNATYGYQFNGTAGKIAATQSGAPNTNMLWTW